MAPWTQGIEVAWRPELRYYEARIAILRDLEDAGDLAAFMVRDDAVYARLFDGDVELSVRQNGLNLALHQPTGDFEESWKVASAVLGRIKPSEPLGVTVRFQHVETVEMEFREAIEASSRALLIPSYVGVARLKDWAMLMDVEVVEGVDTTLEFGIVRAAELPARLARMLGRISHEHRAAQSTWLGIEFPDVALFIDSAWVSKESSGEITDDLAGATLGLWAAARTEADMLAEAMSSAIGRECAAEQTREERTA